MTIKDVKKESSKSYTELEHWLAKNPGDIWDIAAKLQRLPNFKNFTYVSRNLGIIEFNYANMTLKIYEKDGIIVLDRNISLWNPIDTTGWIGNFTNKTLSMESKSELD